MGSGVFSAVWPLANANCVWGVGMMNEICPTILVIASNWKPPQLDRCRDPPVGATALPICIMPPTLGKTVGAHSMRKKLSDETRTQKWVSGACCLFLWVTYCTQPPISISTFERSSFPESDGIVC